jgi:hypothetical protein
MFPFDNGTSPTSGFVSLTPDNHFQVFPGTAGCKDIMDLIFKHLRAKDATFKSLLIEPYGIIHPREGETLLPRP